MLDEEQKEKVNEKTWYGKGNAKAGFKMEYNLYPPSDVVQRVM